MNYPGCCLGPADRTVRRAALIVSAVAILSGIFPTRSGALPPPDARRPTTQPQRVYVATRLEGPPPRIDGRLDDPCWREGQWAGNFVQREPYEGRPGSQPTFLKILYDHKYLYVAIRAYDTALATLPHPRGNRDQFVGDIVGVNFDSYFDHRTGFEFDLTSGGSKIDLILHNEGWDTSWNAVWDGKVGFERKAWVAEFRIPFSQLRYSRNREQVWGLHSWRWIDRLQEEDDWRLLPMDNPGFVLSFGELHGLRDLPRSRRIELLPYALARTATSAAEAGNPYRTGRNSDVEGGLDAKVGLTTNFTIDATINPDFGQVEADPSEINLTTYETFFAEKRPFFLEGKALFDFGVDDDLLFYSRRIGDRPTVHPVTSGYVDEPGSTRILGAAKVTGKTADGLAAGLLYGLTDREEARIFENGVERRQTVEPLTHYAVARVQQDYDGGRTYLGGMVTATVRRLDAPTRAVLPARAFTGGLDFTHHWKDHTYFVDARLIGSHLEGDPAAVTGLMRNPVHNYQRPDAAHLAVDPAATSLSGSGGFLQAGKDSHGRWRYHATFDWRSPGLDLNDLGYLYVADQVRERTWLEYVVTEPGRLIRRYNIDLDQGRTWDFDGTRLQDMVGLSGGPTFNNRWSLWGHAGYFGDLLDTRVLRGGPALRRPGHSEFGLSVNSDSSRKVRGWLAVESAFARDSGSHQIQFGPGVAARLFDFIDLQAEVSYTSNLEDFQYAGTATAAGVDRYLMGRMNQKTLQTTLRMDINFTPQLSLAYYGSLFASTGRFSDLKLVTRPRAARYEDRFRRIGDAARDPVSGVCTVEDDGATFTFANPDFAWREFKSNLVLRWEYRPGSTLYAVWTQGRANADLAGAFSPGSEYRRLFGAHPDDTFLLKVSYWFNI